MAQTPAQKRANARFAKAEEEKRGKPVTKTRDTERSPIPKWVIVLLAFVVCGSLIFELVRLLFPPEAPNT